MQRKVILILLLSLFLVVHAQDDYGDEYALSVQLRLQQFYDDLEQISTSIASASPTSIDNLQNRFNSLDIRWNTYYAAQQVYIAENENMLSLVARYQELHGVVSDSLANTILRNNAVKIFDETMAFLTAKIPEYDALVSKCEKLALTDKTAPQLERVKASEQLLFAKVTAQYQKGKDAVVTNSSLRNREEEIDNLYLDISSRSEKVQQAQYKPFMERIKEYLLGFAIVALAIMFVSMIQNKIVATKQMRESLKKLKEQYIKSGEDDIPTI